MVRSGIGTINPPVVFPRDRTAGIILPDFQSSKLILRWGDPSLSSIYYNQRTQKGRTIKAVEREGETTESGDDNKKTPIASPLFNQSPAYRLGVIGTIKGNKCGLVQLVFTAFRRSEGMRRW